MTTMHTQNYRGTYHFSPRENWMNDPNGMVYFQGEYHLFFQYHPFGMTWGPMHWGHAVSKDLLTWEELPVALEPDEHGTIFSGSAVVDWNNTTGFFEEEPGLVAIFTHHKELPDTGKVTQYQSLAFSKDKGRTWMKYEGNPVLRHESYVDFRDPKVFWHEPSSQWVMIIACGQTVCLYRSPNLKEWTFASEFGQGMGSHDGVWECPDLFPLPTKAGGSKWVMIVSIGDNPECVEGSRIQYFTGEFDGERFVPDARSKGEARWLDYGRDNYAGVTWSDIPDEDGRRLFIGWMSNWKYANLTPTEGYRGAMTAPRELQLEQWNGEWRLIQQPVREITKVQKEVLSLSQTTASEASAKLSSLQLESYEIHARIYTAHDIGFRLQTGSDEGAIVGWNRTEAKVYVDRSRSGITNFHPDFPGVHSASLTGLTGPLELRILVDRSSVEVFADEGRVVITDLIYPSGVTTGVSVIAESEQPVIESLAVYDLSAGIQTVSMTGKEK